MLRVTYYSYGKGFITFKDTFAIQLKQSCNSIAHHHFNPYYYTLNSISLPYNYIFLSFPFPSTFDLNQKPPKDDTSIILQMATIIIIIMLLAINRSYNGYHHLANIYLICIFYFTLSLLFYLYLSLSLSFAIYIKIYFTIYYIY